MTPLLLTLLLPQALAEPPTTTVWYVYADGRRIPKEEPTAAVLADPGIVYRYPDGTLAPRPPNAVAAPAEAVAPAAVATPRVLYRFADGQTVYAPGSGPAATQQYAPQYAQADAPQYAQPAQPAARRLGLFAARRSVTCSDGRCR